jgi:major membrane immunogen (membrane-anchored lipoprotein)
MYNSREIVFVGEDFMDITQDSDRYNIAYRQLKATIDRSYPRGWFVAVADGKIVAAAADFHELEGTLQGQGRDPRTVLVVEAGVDYPEYVTIFV